MSKMNRKKREKMRRRRQQKARSAEKKLGDAVDAVDLVSNVASLKRQTQDAVERIYADFEKAGALYKEVVAQANAMSASILEANRLTRSGWATVNEIAEQEPDIDKAAGAIVKDLTSKNEELQIRLDRERVKNHELRMEVERVKGIPPRKLVRIIGSDSQFTKEDLNAILGFTIHWVNDYVAAKELADAMPGVANAPEPVVVEEPGPDKGMAGAATSEVRRKACTDPEKMNGAADVIGTSLDPAMQAMEEAIAP